MGVAWALSCVDCWACTDTTQGCCGTAVAHKCASGLAFKADLDQWCERFTQASVDCQDFAAVFGVGTPAEDFLTEVDDAVVIRVGTVGVRPRPGHAGHAIDDCVDNIPATSDHTIAHVDDFFAIQQSVTVGVGCNGVCFELRFLGVGQTVIVGVGVAGKGTYSFFTIVSHTICITVICVIAAAHRDFDGIAEPIVVCIDEGREGRDCIEW